MQRPNRFAFLLIAAALLVWAGLGSAVAAPKPAPAPKPTRASKPGPTSAAPTTPPAASARDSAPPAGGVVAEDARTLLAAVGARYRGLSSYHFEGTSRLGVTMQGMNQALDVPFRLAAVKPAKLLTEIQNPMVSLLTVSDGSQTWVYVPQVSQYTHKNAAPLSAAGVTAAEIGSALAMGTPIQRYLVATEGLVAARILGEQTLEVAGRSIPCTIVEAQYSVPESLGVDLSPNTMWVDRERKIVLRDSMQVRMRQASGDASASMNTVVTFHTARVDEAPPDSLFTFKPPKDARLVESISMPGMGETISPLVGKPAQDFTLVDLAGKTQRLSSLKGKVVLLDFWATWCGPCRREMPNIVKLHRELSKRGLAVVAVNVGENRSTVSTFLKKNAYDLPVWLDESSEVAEKYGASAIPTLVVIDRNGRVSSHKVGMRDEATLRGMLKEAGIR